MRTWRIGDGPKLLVDLGQSLETIPQKLNCMLFPHDYCVVDGDFVLGRYETRVWSDDEQLGASYYAVAGGEFRKHIETWRREEAVILSELTEIKGTEPKAREALGPRIRRFGEALDKELLGTLNQLSAARGAAAEAARSLFAEACLFACFAQPEKVDTGMLIVQLEAIEKTLRDYAEGQDNCDARLNAIAFRKAADRVALAREILHRE